MGLMLLLLVSAYLRPSEALNMKRGDLGAPVLNASRFYSLLIFREEFMDRSTTDESDAAIPLDHKLLRFVDPLWGSLRQGTPVTPLWSFQCPQFLRVRYVNAGRLQYSANLYSAALKSYLDVCEARLGPLMLDTTVSRPQPPCI